jgi:hypothetical protein
MKKYYTVVEFIIGLLGVIIHTIIVIFIVSYLANPGQLEMVIENTTGNEQALLQQFVDDVNRFGFIVYVGSAIVIFEWIAIVQIKKRLDRKTPMWASFLILGALYAYFYFGGLEVFVLLLISSFLSLYRWRQSTKETL